MRHGIEQGAKNVGPYKLELAPKLPLRTPLRISNWGQSQKDRPVAQIRPANYVLDAIEEDRARRFKQHLLLVSVELPYREAAAAREPAEGIGEPIGQAGEIIECEQIAVICCNH